MLKEIEEPVIEITTANDLSYINLTKLVNALETIKVELQETRAELMLNKETLERVRKDQLLQWELFSSTCEAVKSQTMRLKK